MKVVALNGSPKKSGNTYQAIRLVLDELEKEGIETEVIHVGSKKIKGCSACGVCFKKSDERCIFDDGVNEIVQSLKDADGIILGSPVHYSGIGASMKSALDRIFQVSTANGNLLRHKVGASVVTVRRSGGMPTLHQLNDYINYCEMIVPTSSYWNVIHGETPGEVLKDEEGVQIMRVLGKNMAWVMKLVDNGKGVVKAPEVEEKIYTNFVRE